MSGQAYVFYLAFNYSVKIVIKQNGYLYVRS